MKPFLLITNDDGINAPGIRHLYDAVKEFADVAIVAPSSEQSGKALSITWTRPIAIQKFSWGDEIQAWSVSGTPADCVKMACSTLLQKKPDMIISGVNRGSNAGRTVLFSGTVGAVIEATLKNIPGIAFSFSDFTPTPLGGTKEYIFPIIEHFLKSPTPKGTLINVNFPPQSETGIKGVRFAKQGQGYWAENPEKRIHPAGIPYYWLGGKWSKFTEDPMSDVALLEEGYITVVPIHVGNLTCMSTLNSEKASFEKIFSQKESTFGSNCKAPS